MDIWEIDNVTVCLVTKIKDAEGDFMGLPIFSIDDWKPVTDNPLILLAVRESNQEELLDSLSDRGYCNFLSINDFVMEVIKE